MHLNKPYGMKFKLADLCMFVYDKKTDVIFRYLVSNGATFEYGNIHKDAKENIKAKYKIIYKDRCNRNRLLKYLKMYEKRNEYHLEDKIFARLNKNLYYKMLDYVS